MDGQLGVMLDVEEALCKFTENNLHSASLAFFSALGYPVDPLEIAINENMLRFVYVINENRCIFSSDETNTMQSVANISWLFTLSNNVPTLSHIKNARINNIKISSINYFCVELDCKLKDRSIQAFNLTKIIGKVVNSPVVVLFKHAKQLLLSSLFMINGENANISKTYLSDWYPFDPIHDDVLMTLSNWNFGNYCNDNFNTLFVDLVHLTARSYLLNNESFELIKFGRNSIVVRDHPSFDETIVINGINIVCPAEISEQIVELDPRQVYGYDYVNDEESIEILTDDPEWMLEELFDIDDIVSMIDEANLSYDDKDEFELSAEESFSPSDGKISRHLIDGGNVDDAVFEDPIKLLEYLEALD